ncbi:hypothetical protein Taro_020593 [Colocasia esculenta]|uniref:Uncharacterized protein n=1 Tax=Colocasia esculenta TaxID=4460 RepID=A0A843V8X9_COLES|nr:hypothetical protein [Colocasia esculenta]
MVAVFCVSVALVKIRLDFEASLPPSVSKNRAPAHVPPPPASYTMKDGDRYFQSGPVETSQKGAVLACVAIAAWTCAAEDRESFTIHQFLPTRSRVGYLMESGGTSLGVPTLWLSLL